MTHRDRAGDPPGQRAGWREAAGAAGHRQGFPTPAPIRPLQVRLPGTAVSQGFRAAHGFETGRMACDGPHRYATRSWPKTLGNRLYGSLSTLLGIIRQRIRVRHAVPPSFSRCPSTGVTRRASLDPAKNGTKRSQRLDSLVQKPLPEGVQVRIRQPVEIIAQCAVGDLGHRGDHLRHRDALVLERAELLVRELAPGRHQPAREPLDDGRACVTLEGLAARGPLDHLVIDPEVARDLAVRRHAVMAAVGIGRLNADDLAVLGRNSNRPCRVPPGVR